MGHLLIYVFPVLMDTILGAALYVNTVRMADSGASATATTAVFGILYIVYMFACLLVGRIVKPGNAAKLIVLAGIGSAVCSVAFIMIPSLKSLYFLMGCLSITMAMFFVPFQVFMKQVAQGKSQTIVHATAMYTIAWSTGIALGPFYSGIVWQLSGRWEYCFGINAIISLAIAGGIILFRHHAYPTEQVITKQRKKTKADLVPYEKLPDCVLLGWIIAAAGCAALGAIGGLFPKTAAELGMSQSNKGIILALIHATRAAAAIFFLKGHSPWMYRPLPLAIFGVFGLAGLAGFAGFSTVPMFCLAAVSFGICSAGFFFYLVFHAVIHPAKSARYIATNEAVVGVSGFVGPVAGGIIADHFSFNAAYGTMIAIVLAALAIQVSTHMRHRRQVNQLLADI
ncbi:MAG: MFS transporter [Sedimentisphaerales bacterium]|nr:MFS transporter [Sedimentisphaerales bacterium]